MLRSYPSQLFRIETAKPLCARKVTIPKKEGDINIQGQSGATASSYFVISQGGFSSSGIGANTIYGAGGAALNVESGNSDGNVGIGYGSGGGGAIIAFSTPPANQTGGAGAPGIVIVTEYIQ